MDRSSLRAHSETALKVTSDCIDKKYDYSDNQNINI